MIFLVIICLFFCNFFLFNSSINTRLNFNIFIFFIFILFNILNIFYFIYIEFEEYVFYSFLEEINNNSYEKLCKHFLFSSSEDNNNSYWFWRLLVFMTFRNLSFNIDFVYYSAEIIQYSYKSLASILPSLPLNSTDAELTNNSTELESSEKISEGLEERIYDPNEWYYYKIKRVSIDDYLDAVDSLWITYSHDVVKFDIYELVVEEDLYNIFKYETLNYIDTYYNKGFLDHTQAKDLYICRLNHFHHLTLEEQVDYCVNKFKIYEGRDIYKGKKL